MRIGLMSDHPPSPDETCQSDLGILRQCIVALAEQGLPAFWLSSTATAEALRDDPALVPEAVDSLPATCRYVIPCQPYRFAGVPLFCVDKTLWQQRSLHTRLFTFLCLLQRELPSTVWHVWGDISVTFLTVYTAYFLGVPIVASYHAACIDQGSFFPFEWQWIARHVAMAMVTNPADHARLVATGDYPSTRVCLSDPAATTIALYQRLHDSRIV
jgi:hypothetical protein